MYLYRELPDEVVVPFGLPVLHRDDDIVVVDKPHFLATMPRGEQQHPGGQPVQPVRGAYQTLFSRGLVDKTYLARVRRPPASGPGA
ncbi:hypothetical protein MAHJHV33_48310 [Mycobacterium avium subsp. hominissuis]